MREINVALLVCLVLCTLGCGGNVDDGTAPAIESDASTPSSASSNGEWIDLLPSPDLEGWSRIPFRSNTPLDPKMQWRVDEEQQTLICAGDGGHEWLKYDKEFGDFVLQIEWRFTSHQSESDYNAGIGLRMSRNGELYLQAQTTQEGGFLFGSTVIDGAIQRVFLRDQMKENRIKPVGEWNQYEIRSEGDKVTLSVNGAIVNELSGIMLRRGFIGLEAEGYEITFRNMKLMALD